MQPLLIGDIAPTNNIQNPLVVSNGLVAYWSFNDGSGSIARDFSGNRLDGRLVGSVLPVWVPNVIGTGLFFNSGSVQVPTSSLWNNQNLTINMWVNPGTQHQAIIGILDNNHGASTNWVIQSEDATTNRNYYFGYWNGTGFEPAGNIGAGKGMQLTNNVRQMITYTKSGTSVTGYKNGVLAWGPVTAGNANIGYSNRGLWIGNVIGYLDRFFTGTVDEVSIFNRPLNQSEITSLYNSSFRGGQTHPQVIDWRRRVVTNGGAEPSQNTLNALTDFYRGLDSNGLTTKMKSVNCFVPDNLISSITPLIKVAGNDPWTNNNFVAGDLTIDGLVGNGSTKYLDTGVIPNTSFTYASIGVTVYVFSGSTDQREFGSSTANPLYDVNVTSFAFGSSGLYWDCPYVVAGTGAGRLFAPYTGSGYHSANRTSFTVNNAYRASSTSPHTQIGATNTYNATAQTPSTRVMYCHAFNYGGVLTTVSSKRLSFAATHLGLTSDESAIFYNLVQKMRQDLGGGYV